MKHISRHSALGVSESHRLTTTPLLSGRKEHLESKRDDTGKFCDLQYDTLENTGCTYDTSLFRLSTVIVIASVPYLVACRPML